jgi:hypothetical protein
MNTVVFHAGALGDGVLIWPLLRALAPCTLVGRYDRVRLAACWIAGVGAIDGDSAAAAALFAEAGGQSPLADHLAGASRIVSFVSNGRDAWARNARRLAPGAQLACVRPRPEEPCDQHVTDFHRGQLQAAGLSIEPIGPALRVNPDGPVVIHPGSGGRAKCWPTERFEALLDHFTACGRPTVVVLGEAERERWPAARLDRWREARNVCEPADAVALPQRIAGASCYIGNDSGPTHLAAQLGVPTIALFGPSDRRVWRPVGPAVTVIAPPTPTDMTWLKSRAVIAAAPRG